MAHIFQPKYTKPIPPNADVITVKGRRYVSWRAARGGRLIRWPVCDDDPTRYAATSKAWWVRWTDADGAEHQEKVSTVKSIAERRRLEIEDREERIRHGVLPAAVREKPATNRAALLGEWQQSIIDAGNSAGHASLYRRRADAILTGTGADLPGRLTAADVSTLLGEWRRKGIEREKGRGKPLSVETSNHYATAIKALCRWCVDRGYLQGDPLVSLRRLNADRARTFERRALTPDELDRLIVATAGRTTRAAVPGPDRAMAYLLVAYTGFRLKEVSQLTPASFRLSEVPPVVQLPTSKGKPPVVQVLAEPVAERFRAYLASKPVGRLLWYGAAWAKERRASAVLRSDLRAAGIEYKDATGRVVNFHSLRTTFATWLAQAGVPIQHAQKLMRHSDPRLTIAFYTKLGSVDLADQLDKLPPPK